MKRFILSLIAISTGFVLFANPLCGKNIDLEQYATDFLKEKGVVYAKPECVLKTDNLSVFSDSPNRAFVVLAEGKFMDRLGDIVLAYSTESALNGGSDAMVYEIIGRYDAMLSKLKPRRGLFLSRLLGKKKAEVIVEPMLRNFGQGEPYNKLFPVEPEGYHNVVGCGSLALAQILYYHQFPTRGHGQGSITQIGGNKIIYNLENYSFSFDGSEDDIAKVMLCAAASMNGRATAASEMQTTSNDFKGVLMGKWGYSSDITQVKDCDEALMAQLLFEELENGHPVIVVQTGEHTFNCDGLRGSFIHLNFGWNGYCNGWFKVMLYDSDQQRLPFKEMIIGIHPSSTVEKQDGTVTLETPGTLESILGEEQLLSLTSIKIAGPIDGDDIKTLRRMAGAVDDYTKGHGVLMEMDLSEANIVGGKPYHTRLCYNMTISGRYMENGEVVQYYYDMSKISDEDWETILAHGLERSSSRLLSKGENGKYYVTFFAENNIIGKFMFDECQNLVKVKLPVSAVELRSNVFYNCRALEECENIPVKCDPNAFNGSGLQNK